MQWIALLRGINVGGRNSVPMAGLRALFEELGYDAVRTYIQSGNVLFEGPARLKPEPLEQAIAERFDMAPAVVLRTRDELRRIVEAHPFGADTSRTYVTFLTAKPSAEAVRKVEQLDVAPDEVAVRGLEVYLRYPNGLGRSKTPPLVDRALGVPGTNRNWRTVTKLLELAG